MNDLSVDSIRARLASIVESSSDAIISKNLEGVITSWNQAAHRLFGYSETEAVGQPITIIIPPDLRDEEAQIINRLRSGERIDHYETRRLTRDGRLLDVSLTISPLRNAAGTIVGASKILRDITETKRARLALLNSERRLTSEVAAARTLQLISTRLISETNQGSLFEQILDAAMELMASDAASLQVLGEDGRSLSLLGWRNFHPASAAFWQRVTTDADSTCGVALRDNVRAIVTDVESCDFMAGTQDLEEYRRSGIRAVQSTPLCSRAGQPLGMLSTHWHAPRTPAEHELRLFDVLARQAADLIERTRAETALRESEGRFRLLANTAPVLIWMSDVDKGWCFVNQTWLDLTGQPIDAVLGSGWIDHVHAEDRAACRNAYAQTFDRREVFQIEFRLRRRDGQWRWIVSSGVPMFHADGSFAGYMGSALDITERKLATEVLASVPRRLIDAQEQERSRIARELHDDFSQRLAMVVFNLDECMGIGLDLSSGFGRQLKASRDEIMSLAKAVQALSYSLHPARVELLGIRSAAAALCREISGQRGVSITFNADGIAEPVPPRVAVCLYRVLQEALHNAVKHSGAATIEVSLRGGAGQIEMTIRDHGEGFDVAGTQGRGLGLISMRERVRALQGRLVILSQPHHGTTISATVPLLEECSR